MVAPSGPTARSVVRPTLPRSTARRDLVRVVIAPDSFGGTLSATAAAAAIATGWRTTHPDADVEVVPMSDGGEGLLDALLAGGLAGGEVREREVVDPRGLATTARWLLDGDTAVVESAEACGLHLLDRDRRDPRRATTWGVGQLLDTAREAGARRILVGLGGTATVDGGAGALSGLGFRLTVADGSGLKIGGEDLPRVTGAARTWVGDWDGLEVVLLADVDDALLAAPAVYGPQKGADEATVAHLERGLAAWRVVAEQDLGAAPDLADAPGTGAAGGLGYGLAAGLGAAFAPGADTVADLQGLDQAIAGADLVVTGEGRLDGTTAAGKVVAAVTRTATSSGVPTAAVVGSAAVPGDGLADLEEAAPDGPGADPAGEVAAAAARLAGRWAQGS